MMRLGEMLTKQDQNLTLHTYGYDVLGRGTSDSVTFPQGNSQNVDTSILRIETSYNSQGLTDKITSYSSATGGSGAIVNQIMDVYNGFGQLTRQYQEHNGAPSAPPVPYPSHTRMIPATPSPPAAG